ncbi:hypothetical protein D3C85_1592740 [compost metagenome]
MEVLHLIAGDGGKPAPGSIHGLRIAVFGGHQAMEGLIGLGGMGLLLDIEKVQELGCRERHGLLR